MYKATISFAMDDLRTVKQGQILQDEDFKNEAEKNDLLECGYIVEYDDTLEIVENGLYDVKEYENADVNVPSSTPTLQNKSITINENTTTSISADSDYDGLDTVSVTTNVQPNLESKSVEITENTTTTITPTAGKDGLSSVEVITNVSGGGSTGILPAEYQGVEYIESSGTQYINTGVNSQSGLTISVDVRTLRAGNANGILYGGGVAWSNQYIQGEFDPQAAFAYYNSYLTINIPAAVYLSNFFSNVKQLGESIYFNNAYINSITPATFSTNFPIAIFAGNRGGTLVEYGSYLVQRFRILQGTTKLRDMIACYRKSDNEIGLYDIVNDVFYTNQGTGTFGKGNDLTYWE